MSTSDIVAGEPWFSDGNIILQAETTLFKVHRSILATSSPVFAGMFSIPQPPIDKTITQDDSDACPVFAVAESAEEWRIVLEVLFLSK